MLAWVNDNVEVLSLAVSVAMLLVWFVYLHVFLLSFRRERRSKIIINVGAGTDLDARCLVSNMSSESIYVESIVASLIADGEELRGAVTDTEMDGGKEKPMDLRSLTHQGPLKPGEYMDVGRYRDLLGRLVGGDEPLKAMLEAKADTNLAVQVLVIADYASEDLLVGARRRFVLHHRDDHWHLDARDQGTKQIRSRFERSQLRGSTAG